MTKCYHFLGTMKAIAYTRVSTTDQELGLEAQKTAILDWAKRTGHDIMSWHSDQGISGATPIADCPGLSAALEQLNICSASFFVVAKRDRLGRDCLKVALVEACVNKSHAKVVSTAGEGESDSPGDMLMRRIIDAFSEYERLIIKSRTKAAMAAKRVRLERCSSIAPFGWTFNPDGIHLDPDDREQEILVRVVELRLQGLSIRKTIEALGPVSRAGTHFSTSAVKNMERGLHVREQG